MNTHDFTDTDRAALGLGDNNPCGFIAEPPARQACIDEWGRVQAAIDPALQNPATPDGPRIAALNAERWGYQREINEALRQRPDIRARIPAALLNPGPDEAGPVTLATIRANTRRVRRLRAAVIGLATLTPPAGGSGGGGGGGGGSSGGGQSTAQQVAALHAQRDALTRVIQTAFQARPELRQQAPQDLLSGPPARNLVELQQVVARLTRLVAWLEAQPASNGQQVPATITPTATAAAAAPVNITAAQITPATFGPQWGSTALEPDQEQSAQGTIAAAAFGRPARWAGPESVGPQWGSSALPCGLGNHGMGSWLSSLWKKATGTRLTDVVAGAAGHIPVVGGVVSNIIAGAGGSAGQVVQQVAQSLGLTQQQVAQIAAGKPCQGVSAAQRAACQAEIARIAETLRARYGAAAGAAPCAHLPASLKVKCQNERRAAWEQVVRALNAGQAVPPATFAALTADEQQAALAAAATTAAATSAAAASASKLSTPVLLAAAGTVALLALGGRR